MYKNIIKYGKQKIEKDDILNVVETLKSDFLTTGPTTKQFEKELKNKLGPGFVSTCSSGTAALHLSLMAIGLKKNDIVILPAINFIAVTNLCTNLGARIFLADVDQYTGQMTPQTLLECMKINNLEKKVKVVVTMYNGGFPFNFKEFYKLKKKYSFYLIEDACHALGAKYSNSKNYFVGNCKYSDITTFSLHPVKSITTGEGGIVTTNNKFFFKKIELLKNHGIIRKKNNYKENIWYYQVTHPGYNYRLSDIASALGLSQLKKIDKFINIRKKNFDYYKKLLNKLDKYINLPNDNINFLSANHLFIINLKNENLKISRNQFIQELFKFKILCQVHYIPIFKHQYYKKLKKKYLLNSERYFERSFSLPMHANLKKKDIMYICQCLEQIINIYKKN